MYFSGSFSNFGLQGGQQKPIFSPLYSLKRSGTTGFFITGHRPFAVPAFFAASTTDLFENSSSIEEEEPHADSAPAANESDRTAPSVRSASRGRMERSSERRRS